MILQQNIGWIGGRIGIIVLPGGCETAYGTRKEQVEVAIPVTYTQSTFDYARLFVTFWSCGPLWLRFRVF